MAIVPSHCLGTGSTGSPSRPVPAMLISLPGRASLRRASERIEMAILAYFGLNAVHFLLLTYPRLAV